MRGIIKPLFLIFVILASYVGVAAWGFWAVMIRPGLVWVDIAAENRHHHSDISVGIPAVLIDSVVGSVASTARVSRWAPDDEIAEWAPMIGAIAGELERYPDFVLLEVEDRNDHVIVERTNGAIRVRVNDGDECITVVFPRDSSRRVLRALAQI